jgi:primosomal protein N'
MEEEQNVTTQEVENQGEGLYYPPGYKGEVSSPSPEQQGNPVEKDPTEPIIKSWEEDRQKLDSLEEENKKLKIELSKYGRGEDDEKLDGMTEDERIDYLLKKKEEEKKAEEASKAEKEKRELRFLKIKDKYFVENEKEIVKLAKDEGLTVKQALSIHQKQAEMIKKLKKSPVVPNNVPQEQPKQQGRHIRSFGEMYREGI